jgi:signal transduction histidine kinase
MDRAPVVDAVDVASTLADTLVLVESKARGKSVETALDVQTDLPAVPGIAGQLHDVWLNLVDNAIDAASAGGRVSVSARREGAAIVIRVIDDGAGIPSEDQARVFEPFFTTKPVGQGAGLGLDVVQRIVRSHEGTVELSSQPGRTEFRVTLPVSHTEN